MSSLPVRTFRTATERDATFPSPTLGQLCYLANSGSLLEYNGPAIGWSKPWNDAWGSVGYSKVIGDVMAAASSTGVLADFSQGTQVPVTTVPNRIYEVRFGAYMTSSADGDVLEVRVIWLPGVGHHNYTPWSTGTPTLAAFKKVDLTGIAPCSLNMKRRYGTNLIAGTIPTGSGTFIMALGQITGTGGVMVNTTDVTSFLEVFDIGSAGAPPLT